MQEVLNTDIFNTFITTYSYIPNLTATGKQLEFLLSMFFMPPSCVVQKPVHT